MNTARRASFGSEQFIDQDTHDEFHRYMEILDAVAEGGLDVPLEEEDP